jgi:dTDP-4-dehydrorhamnose reductase
MRRVLILGAGGMLGYTLLRHLAARRDYEVHGALRSSALPKAFGTPPAELHLGVDALEPNGLEGLLERLRPDEVINCIGLIKQLNEAQRPRLAIEINALLPHRLAEICSAIGARLIHFSTDCVFAGNRGGYRESDRADADDLYGRSKHLGEVVDGGHLTLRTSLIGHELRKGVSLVDWFLASREPVSGYSGVIFSGLPTVEVARVLAEHVLGNRDLQGLYHLSAEPIDKDRLLRLVARIYGHEIPVHAVDEPRLDRSLDSQRLREVISYRPSGWPELVHAMHADYLSAYASARADAACIE